MAHAEDGFSIPRTFQTTHWSWVRSAVKTDRQQALVALEQLCQSYWYPLYAYIRSSGYPREDAEDLIQSFFAKLLEKDILSVADPEKGKLRTFLMTCLSRYLKDEYDKTLTQKRGARRIISLDANWAEGCYTAEPVDTLSPDRLFQRRWALTLLEFSFGVLADEYAAQGKGDLFNALRPFLGFAALPTPQYEAVASQLEMPVGTVKSHVHRLRQRWRDLLFEQVAITLGDASPAEIRSELSELLESV